MQVGPLFPVARVVCHHLTRTDHAEDIDHPQNLIH